jgi:tetratricopeptide (TPR) repeat protein
MQVERYEDARDSYWTAIGLGEDRVVCFQNLGCSLAMIGDYRGAVKIFLLCIGREKFESRHWFNLGSAWYQQRRYRDAIAAFVEANELIPEEDSLRFNIYMELGKSLLKIKHSGEAESAFSHALEINSKDLDCRLNFAVSLNNQGQRAKAIESLDQTLLLFPDSKEALKVQRKILGNLLRVEPVR